jgi:DNA-binding NarL/FixJ family response regulator
MSLLDQRPALTHRGRDEDRPRLTTREAEVLVMVVSGLTCRQVASRLFLSRRTVENHLHRTMRKLAVRNRAELVRAALSQELV